MTRSNPEIIRVTFFMLGMFGLGCYLAATIVAKLIKEPTWDSKQEKDVRRNWFLGFLLLAIVCTITYGKV